MNRSLRVASVASPRASYQAGLALLTGSALLASMSVSALGLATARADAEDDRRSKQYKIGAAVLGGAAVYFGLKKKNPVAAAAAGAGAYYAYKKGEELKNRNRYGYDYPDADSGNATYPDDGAYAGDYGYGNGGYASYPDNTGGYGVPAGDYSNDYGYGAPDGGYASSGDQYPDYGLRGLKGRRAGAKAPAKATQRSAKRAVVK